MSGSRVISGVSSVSNSFPPIYLILDFPLIRVPLPDLLRGVSAAGVRLLQLRNKPGTARDNLRYARDIMTFLSGKSGRLIVNDRPDIAMITGAGGVHVGQDDLSPMEARMIVGSEAWVGLSTHTLEQVRAADSQPVDYIAIGPIFSTLTKEKLDPVVGLEFIRAARAITRKPLVAIGGITLQYAREAFAAGADSLAVARDILAAQNPAEQAGNFVAIAEENCRD